MYSLITGGSSGLGLSIAKALVTKGESVIITGRSKDKLNNAENALKHLNSSVSIHTIAVDLSNEAGVKNMFDTLAQSALLIKNLFNIAGSGYYGDLNTISKNDIMTVLNNNLISLMLVTIHGLCYFEKHPAKRHKVVSILSTAALKGKAKETIYNASKFGAKGFLLSVEDEVKDKNVDIIRVYPGGMTTPFWDNSPSGYPVDTFMSPDDVAQTILNAIQNDALCPSDITINRPKG